jgi:predicted outer membrane repeat protein
MGSLTLAQTVVSNNSAVGNGGGLTNVFGAIVIEASTVSGNSAGGRGGAIFNDNGTLLIRDSRGGFKTLFLLNTFGKQFAYPCRRKEVSAC